MFDWPAADLSTSSSTAIHDEMKPNCERIIADDDPCSFSQRMSVNPSELSTASQNPSAPVGTRPSVRSPMGNDGIEWPVESILYSDSHDALSRDGFAGREFEGSVPYLRPNDQQVSLSGNYFIIRVMKNREDSVGEEEVHTTPVTGATHLTDVDDPNWWRELVQLDVKADAPEPLASQAHASGGESASPSPASLMAKTQEAQTSVEEPRSESHVDMSLTSFADTFEFPATSILPVPPDGNTRDDPKDGEGKLCTQCCQRIKDTRRLTVTERLLKRCTEGKRTVNGRCNPCSTARQGCSFTSKIAVGDDASTVSKLIS
ncbi:hypothetical protein QFC24_005138 [Naganishia onofrii]|uniref:Uncharacterized protein n=1 Tax=Naganishia onofrii TaxID=1851511 RepID=A0ACC2XAN1_9TREE|nr:hypothetical protein QFC24_005138 [Naganishia onofrii]